MGEKITCYSLFSREDLLECARETNCKANNETYPTCIWKTDDELNKTRTTTPKAPASPPPFTRSTKQPCRNGCTCNCSDFNPTVVQVLTLLHSEFQKVVLSAVGLNKILI